MSKYLVAPLNWGLGHASRCVPLVQRLLDEGNEVILGGDGESLTLLRRHFPKCRYVFLAPLNLRYGKGKRQVWAMVKALPKLIAWAYKDHMMLQAVLREEKIDMVVSDNRFGLYTSSHLHGGTEGGFPLTVYITHQLHIFLPAGWRWLEPLVARLHARIYARYNKVWVPDYEDPKQCLAGELSHPQKSFVHRTSSLCTLSYIGPLSRFSLTAERANSEAVYQRSGLSGKAGLFDVVAVLSGLEPQRTMLERELIRRYSDSKENVLIVQGLLNRPNTRIKRGAISLVPHMGDAELAEALKGAKHIIVRSGYSTVMDLEALSLLPSMGRSSGASIEFIPTPGQPEQEYLAHFWAQKCQK